MSPHAFCKSFSMFIVDFHRICEIILEKMFFASNLFTLFAQELKKEKEEFALRTRIFSKENQKVLEKDTSRLVYRSA